MNLTNKIQEFKRIAKREHHFWLRAEVKPDEQRSLFLPEHVNQLIEAGNKVTVEKCPQRCIPISEYSKNKKVEIADCGSWPDALKDAIISGLKELPDDNFPLVHTHIFFAHAYKGQFDAPKILGRFNKGKGKLYDLEYLVDDTNRRIAAFGFSAGMAGAGIGTLVWAWRRVGHHDKDFPQISTFKEYKDLSEYVKGKLAGQVPTAIVIGGYGRVGSGAVTMLKSVGIEPTIWDHESTQGKTGPFEELLATDIFVNAILLSSNDNFTFLNSKMLKESKGKPGRKLDTIIDISCDLNNPKNPIPLYKELTSFKSPSKRLKEEGVDVIQIDHLPSLVPFESSKDFTGQLMPHLHEFPNSPVWERALNVFNEKRKLYKE